MKRIVIDCDPGIDDAVAIIMADQHPEIQIEAITSVCGNVGLDQTTANVLRILDVLNARPIPVYAGASSALVEPGENASFVHGEDGLGGASLPDSTRKIEEDHAALALSNLSKNRPGELSLIAIGPLTNLALALRLDPNLPAYYDRLVIMGGAHYAQGNTSSTPAEFNIFADPDAAAVVFESWPKLTMVTWEATLSHGIPLADFRSLMENNNPRSQFLGEATQGLLAFLKDKFSGEMSYAADPLAMAVMIEPEIVTHSIEKYVRVERYGRLSRGMTVVDWWGNGGHPPNVEIVLEVDQERFYDLLRRSFT